MKTVMVVDDEPKIVQLARDYLEHAGFAVVVAPDGKAALATPRAQLLDAVHGVAFESYERAIDAHVKNIRHKLEPDPATPRYLLTVYGVGYRFAELDE